MHLWNKYIQKDFKKLTLIFYNKEIIYEKKISKTINFVY